MKKIETLRSTIDALDKQIMALLDKRFDTARAVGDAKKDQNLAIADTKRETHILESCDRYPNAQHLRAIYKTIFTTSKALQKDD